tara:strand:+ start:1961 stop:3310 length:1350 start_codon:yes stop_codon:yes gene_type:complete
MREIIENSIRENAITDAAKAQDFQVLDLGFSSKCWQLAAYKLAHESYSNKEFRVSVSIENNILKLTMIMEKPPHEGLEFERTLNEQELSNLPDKIKKILDDQGYIHISGSKPLNIRASNHPRGTRNERMFLIVGYGSCGLASYYAPPNSGSNNELQSSLHGSNAGLGLQSATRGASNAAILNTVCWFESVFNAANNFSVKEKSRLKFASFAKSKKLFAKAGRSKPQGDLIIYFGEDSCLAEGVNGAGTETMKLQNSASLKELESYESDNETGYVKSTFNYPLIYATMMSAAKGFAPPDSLDYGIDENNMPFVELNYPQYDYYDEGVRVKYTIRSNAAVSAELPSNDLNIINMKRRSHTPNVVNVVRTPVQSGSADTPTVETPKPAHQLNSEESKLVAQWYEAYVSYNGIRGLPVDSIDPINHFNAFMMLQIEQGNEIDKEHFDLYNSLK